MKQNNFLKLLFIIFLSFVISLRGESLTITMENDFIAHHDRYYTHGTRLMYSPDYFIYNVPIYTNWNNESSIILGQNMYTPSNISNKEKIIGDRPYSGYLYMGYLIEFRKNNIADLWELDIGISGEKSFTKEIQMWMHERIGSRIPMGWDNQVDEKILGTLIYYKKYKWKWDYADIIIRAGGSPLSNLNANIGSGMQCRIGFGIPDDFGLKRMEPNTREWNQSWSLYLLVDFDYRHIFYYYFLNHDIEKEYQINMINNVCDFSYGIGMSYNAISIRYLINYRTKEFEQQDHFNKFGTILLTFEF